MKTTNISLIALPLLLLAGLIALSGCTSNDSNSDSDLAQLLALSDPAPQCNGDFDTALSSAMTVTPGTPLTITAYEGDICVFQISSDQDSFFSVEATPLSSVDINLAQTYRGITPVDEDNYEYRANLGGNGTTEILPQVGFFSGESRYIWVEVYHGTCGNGCQFTLDVDLAADTPVTTATENTACVFGSSPSSSFAGTGPVLFTGTLTDNTNCRWVTFTADRSGYWNFELLSKTGEDLDLYATAPYAVLPPPSGVPATPAYSSNLGVGGFTEWVQIYMDAGESLYLIADAYSCSGFCKYLFNIY